MHFMVLKSSTVIDEVPISVRHAAEDPVCSFYTLNDDFAGDASFEVEAVHVLAALRANDYH